MCVCVCVWGGGGGGLPKVQKKETEGCSNLAVGTIFSDFKTLQHIFNTGPC